MTEAVSTRAGSLGLAFFVSASGLLLAFVLGILTWSFETMLIVGGVVALLTPLAVRLGGGRGLDVALGLVIALLFGSALLTWRIPEVRQVVASRLGAHLPAEALVQAMDDPERSVALSACQGLVFREYSDARPWLKDLLQRPQIAALCLREDVPESENDDSFRRLALASWFEQLQGEQNGCALISPYCDLHSKHFADTGAELLAMIALSKSPETRNCAQEELGRRYSGQLEQLRSLGNPQSLEVVRARQLFDGLAEVTYSPQGDPKLKEFVSQPMITQWGLSLGCALINQGETVNLERLMVINGCDVAGVTSDAEWEQTCQIGVENPNDGLVTTHGLCRALTRVKRDKTVEVAKGLLVAGLSAEGNAALSQSVVRGDALSRVIAEKGEWANAFQVEEMMKSQNQDLVHDMRGLRHELANAELEQDGEEPDDVWERTRNLAEKGVRPNGELSPEFQKYYDDLLGEHDEDNLEDDDDE